MGKPSRSAPRNHWDVVVIGAGPAGASAAKLLADWGHQVIVLSRPAPTPHLAETIPPSAEKLLQHIGWSEAMERAGFIRSTGNAVAWSATADGRKSGLREALYPEGALGFQVERGALNRLLLDGVIAGDAQLFEDAAVTGVHARNVQYVASGETREDNAQWILDCSGRSGVCSRGSRRAVTQLRTLAIAGVWERRDGWPLVDPTHTVVESHANGWAWSVPLSETKRQVTVMVDPRLTSVSGRGTLATAYETELQHARGLWDDTREATLQGEPFARDASPYRGERVAQPGILLVGDAGSFVDPLSSYGIKKALASAWLAAVVVHTSLTDESMTDAALQLFEARERAIYNALEMERAALAQTAFQSDASGFWSARRESATVEAESPNDDVDVESLRRDTDVQAAFAALKERESINLAIGAGVRRVRQPTVRGNRVVLEERLHAPAVASDMRFVRNVDLVALLDLAPTTSQVPDLYDVYCKNIGAVPLGDFLGALALLVGKRMLVFA